MDYSPWVSKNLINQNWLKKFMQVGVDFKCMYTNFGGRGLSGFGDIATFKFGQISLSDHGLLQSMGVKKFNQSELTRKIYASRNGCVIHIHQFWWVWAFRFRRYCYPQNWPNFPFWPWTIYSPWVSKNLINRNWLKKFMQVGMDVYCMNTNFGGHGLSSFGDIGL